MKTNCWLIVATLLVVLLASQRSIAQRQQKLIDSLKTTFHLNLPDTTRANTYYDIANAFYKQNKFDSANYYLDKTKAISQRINYQAGLGDVNRLKGAMYRQLGRYEDALAVNQTAITHYTKAGKLSSIANVHHNLGWLYKNMGESQRVLAYTRQGIDHVNQAIAINKRIGKESALVDNYIHLGILYEDLGENKLGRDCFFKAIAINDEKVHDPGAYRVLYNNLGKNFNVEGQYEQAIVYLNKALAIDADTRTSSNYGHSYRNLATAYMGLKQPEKAVQYAEKALEQAKLAKDASLSNSVYKVLSRTYVAAGQYEKAYATVLVQKRIEDSLMNLEKTRNIAELQGEFQVKQAQALAAIKADLALAKASEIARIEADKAKEIASIQAEENQRIAQIKATVDVEKTRAIADIQEKYDTQKRIHQIDSLNAQNQLRSKQLKQMTIGLGVLGLLLAVLVGQYYVIRRANRQLSNQNGIITRNSYELARQSEQLRTLMQELHHRVKNNLAIVSSLLNLQISGLRDEKAIQAIRVGQQRVEAMSLIHQQLYRTNELTVIDMREYLTNLANSLLRAYGYQDSNFRLQLDIDKQELDVDIAIPIGLIVNELMTNAFKYAYLEHRAPMLRIKLEEAKALSGLTLEVQDNGPGIEIAEWMRNDKLTSFGKLLITSLSKQLDGQFELFNENGSLFRLFIPSAHATPVFEPAT